MSGFSATPPKRRCHWFLYDRVVNAELTEAVPLLLNHMKRKSVPIALRAEAAMALVTVGTKEHVPGIESLLEDKTEVSPRVQSQDVALLACVNSQVGSCTTLIYVSRQRIGQMAVFRFPQRRRTRLPIRNIESFERKMLTSSTLLMAHDNAGRIPCSRHNCCA